MAPVAVLAQGKEVVGCQAVAFVYLIISIRYKRAQFASVLDIYCSYVSGYRVCTSHVVIHIILF